ncbi:hypothetical protein [Lacrimispora saccharolytica]|uniref:Uncharacterized protein n=1 Tax=Lacrimispora saccharolytica (strain ATCC 35040 / DSM 2544 / NRCC 2533 / WM1) TaxID=610130 RepID=D9R1S2_LACSW|nr:hypothetical protein [Lacrimispora saccharolytica]ADL02813.1 hypothetical protein Closa_0170 [[Clostridium] saccharolyticum WM1]QRV18978.1 hypothetical protein I6K70_16070 [Lacrimispora saccharolytica]
MPNYRRLISYIYAYEGAVKGKNIGFAKIETRGVQCKITVSVKRIYVGGNDIGVFLLAAADQEIFLGNIFIRGGSGEFRTVVSASDIEHSGINVDQCYGLTIHDVKNTWRSYTTIWEDAVAHAAEVDLGSMAAAISGKEQAVISEEQIKRAVREIEEEFPLKSDESQEALQTDVSHADEALGASSKDQEDEMAAPASEIQEQPEENDLQAENLDAEAEEPDEETGAMAAPDDKELVNAESENVEQIMSDETETEIETEEEVQYDGTEEIRLEEAAESDTEPDASAAMNARQQEYWDQAEEPIPEALQEELQSAEEPIPEALQEELQSAEEPMPEALQEELQSAEEPVSEERQSAGQEDIPDELQGEELENREAVDVQEREAVFSEPYPCSGQDMTEDHTLCYRADAVIKEDRSDPEVRPELGNPDELERLRQNEDMELSSHEMIWEKLKREHTRILAFDYEDGCEILTIKPQDIGLLPRDAWVYGNNSFLLHGYYNYRYLILAKLLNPSGMPRYLLGIPGHYYSNERYMASMFGFPNFVLSKDQPMEDGRFGFWYTDVKLGG